MRRYNIVTFRKYTDRDGNEKTFYPNVGSLIRFEANNDKPESFMIELNMFPNTKFGVLEQKEREQGTQQKKVEQKDKKWETSDGIDYPEDSINPSDIPFK